MKQLEAGTVSAAQSPHVIIGGFGRSGSNLILKMFDIHERTHCRNEPNDLHHAAMPPLAAFFPEDMPPDFERAWPAAVERVSRTIGARDNLPATRKVFLKAGALPRLAGWLQSKRRLRRLAGLGDEWACPALIYDRRLLAGATPVLKMMLVGAALTASHGISEGQHLVHIIRRPEGFLNSWYNRYVLRQPGGGEKVWADSLVTLPRILEHFGEDPARCNRFGMDTLVESELWRWRYLNEMLQSLARSPRYLAVAYEDAMARPVETARGLFAFAGLAFESGYEDRLNTIENRTFAKPHQERLDSATVTAAIDRVLEASTLGSIL